ncbi:hypothetical protein CC1G_10337 [Coprinopsis cinerea okayama7|uniref:MICOS complex subunit MIC12 n=1 Tax=Coprinopsis cinerea (strain Okayama-7 / 130 / ATCC MYA-4618 / FGSC 9003) TaxID=240176 RepID=A8P0K9_COPC7|nr:hypothetical protein CC1G_10337 [Coprinopsis cinerea okayama7\|eukprot:XP_001837916.2 hypothetical protein CC1G_10337 [Coprinopsis cinerea okayama7\
MSYFLGPISGALVAGGVYYGFSSLITKSTSESTSRYQQSKRPQTKPKSSLPPTRPYAPSYLITAHPNDYTTSLRYLSNRLLDTPAYIPAPPPAAARVHHNEFTETLKSRWNQEIAYIAAGFRGWGRDLTRWGNGLLEKLPTPSPAPKERKDEGS